MTKRNETVSNANNSTITNTSAHDTSKPRKLSKLEKSIQSMQERAKELRDGYDYERLEHCKCLFFIMRNYPSSFVSFVREFGENADWEKLCNKEIEIRNAAKTA